MTLGDPDETKVIQAAIKMGYEEGRAQEREAIVDWLKREENKYPTSHYGFYATMIREEIEDKEYLK